MPTCNTCKRDVAKCELVKRGGSSKKKKKGKSKCIDCEHGKLWFVIQPLLLINITFDCSANGGNCVAVAPSGLLMTGLSETHKHFHLLGAYEKEEGRLVNARPVYKGAEGMVYLWHHTDIWCAGNQEYVESNRCRAFVESTAPSPERITDSAWLVTADKNLFQFGHSAAHSIRALRTPGAVCQDFFNWYCRCSTNCYSLWFASWTFLGTLHG